MASTWKRFSDEYYEDFERGLVLVRETADTIGAMFFPEGTKPGWFVYKRGHDKCGRMKNRIYLGPFSTMALAKAAAGDIAGVPSPPKVKVVGTIPPGEPVKPIKKSVLRDAAGKGKEPKKTKPAKKKGERGTR